MALNGTYDDGQIGSNIFIGAYVVIGLYSFLVFGNAKLAVGFQLLIVKVEFLIEFTKFQ